MTSGTPESIQNWVLSGFQNCLDFASMSCLEAKAISSSATVTSSASRKPAAPRNHMPRSAQPNKYRTNRLLSSGSVACRLTQPELLIMIPADRYPPPQMRRQPAASFRVDASLYLQEQERWVSDTGVKPRRGDAGRTGRETRDGGRRDAARGQAEAAPRRRARASARIASPSESLRRSFTYARCVL